MRAPLPSLALAALLTLVASPLHAARGWQLTTADATYRSGTYASMRLDRDGQPHISSWPSGGLRYTWRDAGGWHGEQVPYPSAFATAVAPSRVAEPARTELLVWLLSSIAIDTAGWPHVAWTYTNDTSVTGPTYTPIWYSTRTDAGWVSEAAGPEHGEAPSLDVDSAGRPSIAYATTWIGWSGSSALHCARKDAGAWSVTVIDSQGWAPSLRVDTQGIPHAAYVSPGGLRYASLLAGSWTSEPVDPAGGDPSLALGPDGEPRIAYLGAGLHVAYAERHLGTWTISVADSSSGMDIEPSLALSPTGEPRIAYESQGAFRPWLAERNGGVWSAGAIDPSHDGYTPQVGVDAVGQVFVAYADNMLQVMRWAEGSHATTVPEASGTGALSIAGASPVRVGDPLRLRIVLDTGRPVSFEVFDLGGRRLATREAEAFTAGRRDVTWSPRIPHPGVYLVRARDAAGPLATLRVVELR